MTDQDVQILRALAMKLAELALDKVHKEKAEMWARLTSLDTSVRPMVLTHLWPLAWQEVLPDEAVLQCESETARYLRKTLSALFSRTSVMQAVCQNSRKSQ